MFQNVLDMVDISLSVFSLFLGEYQSRSDLGSFALAGSLYLEM